MVEKNKKSEMMKNLLNYKIIFFSLILFFCLQSISYAEQAQLEWDESLEANLEGYKIYYKVRSYGAPYDGTGASEGSSPITIAVADVVAAGGKVTYTVNGLTDNEAYCFAVTAYETYYESDYSNVDCFVAGLKVNVVPTAAINSPSSNVTIGIGDSVNFTGTGVDTDNHVPLTYLWDFSGGAANSTAQNPGDVIFYPGGIYNVTFTVTDSILGVSTPAAVQVNVIPTLSQWGLISLTILMLSGGILTLRRSNRIIGGA